MTGMKIITLIVAMVMIGTVVAAAEEMSATDLIKKVEDTYRTMKTYKAEGTIIADIKTSDTAERAETSFSILLKKPSFYRITWSMKSNSPKAKSYSGAVWNDGAQPLFYNGLFGTCRKVNNDQLALACATGVSSGAANTIPSLFLDVSAEKTSPFSLLMEPRIEKTEKIGKEACYVLSASSAISRKETFWISQKRFLIIKHERALELPEKGVQMMPDMTKKDIEDALNDIGEKVTEKKVQDLDTLIKFANLLLETWQFKGTHIELHENISSPKLNKNDFKFTPPEDTVFHDSMFDGS
jgi:outer membrane lipoprotein-sorting protein